MKLDRARVVLRPRSVLEVFDLSFRFVFALGAGLYVRLWLMSLLPVAVVLMLLHHLLVWPWWATWLVALLVATVLQGVFTLAAGHLMFDARVTPAEVLRAFGRRLLPYLGALLWSRLLMLLASLLCVLLPVVLVRALFVHEATLLEQAGGRAAMKRSTEFTRGQSDHAVAAGLGLFALTVASIITCEGLGRAFVEYLLMLDPIGLPLGEAIGSPYAIAGYLVSIPFTATARFLAYVDARTRRDGWDLQVRFLGMAAASRRVAGEGSWV